MVSVGGGDGGSVSGGDGGGYDERDVGVAVAVVFNIHQTTKVYLFFICLS